MTANTCTTLLLLGFCLAVDRAALLARVEDSLAAFQTSVQTHDVAPEPDTMPQWLQSVVANAQSTGQSLVGVLPDPNILLEWQMVKAENGTTATFELDKGCAYEKTKTNSVTCQVNPLDTHNAAHFDINLAKPLDGTCKIKMETFVHVLAMKNSFEVNCAVCGKPCKVDAILGQKMELPMPPCPITNDWDLDLPLTFDTTASVIPFRTVFDMKTTITRGDGSTVAAFRTHLQK